MSCYLKLFLYFLCLHAMLKPDDKNPQMTYDVVDVIVVFVSFISVLDGGNTFLPLCFGTINPI